MDVAGKTAVVTGAARRIGREIALSLADAGANVVIHYHHSQAEAEATIEVMQSRGHNGVAICADLSSESEIAAFARRVCSEHGPVQILVNNASVFEPGDTRATSTATLIADFKLHVAAPFELTKALAVQLPEAAEACVVNMMDWRSETPDYRHLAYSVSKAALRHLTRAMAIEFAPRTRVNGLSLGPVFRAAHEPDDNYGVRESLLARPVGIDEVLDAFQLLVRCDSMTGSILEVDGGGILTRFRDP